MTKLVIEYNMLEILVDDSETIGKYRYLVGLKCGGVVENPECFVTQLQIIRANSDVEALNKYNETHDISYYPSVIVQYPVNVKIVGIAEIITE